MILSKLKILTTLLFFFFSTIAFGAGDAEKPISKSWSFEGIFGTSSILTKRLSSLQRSLCILPFNEAVKL